VVDEAVQVQLHLQRRVPLLEGEHGAPVQPEVAVQKIAPQHLVDALVLHLCAGGQEKFDDVLLGLLGQREQAIGVRVLAPIDGGALQRVVGIVLVEPVELVEHTGIRDLQRRDGAEQVPQAFEVVLHLAPASDHEALLGLLDTIERTARQRLLLQDGDAMTRHVGIAHEERRPRQ